jgi:hypothetical protein
MIGETPYEMFVDHVAQRGEVTWLPHPALKVSAARPT